jgi:hypothetical protein
VTALALVAVAASGRTSIVTVCTGEWGAAAAEEDGGVRAEAGEDVAGGSAKPELALALAVEEVTDGRGTGTGTGADTGAGTGAGTGAEAAAGACAMGGGTSILCSLTPTGAGAGAGAPCAALAVAVAVAVAEAEAVGVSGWAAAGEAAAAAAGEAAGEAAAAAVGGEGWTAARLRQMTVESYTTDLASNTPDTTARNVANAAPHHRQHRVSTGQGQGRAPWPTIARVPFTDDVGDQTREVGEQSAQRYVQLHTLH